MGMFNNPAQQQQAAKLGQDRTGLFQSLFPNTKMGPPTPQNPAMLAAGIAPRPASALNEPAPFVGPVRPPPKDPATLGRADMVYKAPVGAPLDAKSQKAEDKRLQSKAPPVKNVFKGRESMGTPQTTLQKMDAWEAKLRENGNGFVSGVPALFSPPIPKTREQLIKENPKSELARAYSTMGTPASMVRSDNVMKAMGLTPPVR